MNKKVLIALPAKDEERKLGPVLDAIRESFPGTDILIVDDGSTDRTSEVGRAHGADVLRHDRNRGYAPALQSAREYALGRDYDYLVLCDADGQHEPRDIGRIIEALTDAGADYVIASRVLGSAPHGDPFLHKYGRRLYSLVVSLLFYHRFRTRITDSSSGFKGWNRRTMTVLSEIYKGTDRKLHDGRINDLEELFIMARRKYTVMEVPGRFYKRADDVSRIYGNYGLSGGAVRIKDLIYVLSWPVLFFRVVLRNVWSGR
jgi:glycosyltransferase involved in cell wall biosynthesis